MKLSIVLILLTYGCAGDPFSHASSNSVSDSSVGVNVRDSSVDAPDGARVEDSGAPIPVLPSDAQVLDSGAVLDSNAALPSDVVTVLHDAGSESGQAAPHCTPENCPACGFIGKACCHSDGTCGCLNSTFYCGLGQ